MSGFKDKFADRQQAAAKAKAALQERFKTRPAPDDPEVLARQAERRAIIEAREAREAEREIARAAEKERQAELARLEAVAREEQKARELQELMDQQEREVALKAAQKAARDARYAARKARG